MCVCPWAALTPELQKRRHFAAHTVGPFVEEAGAWMTGFMSEQAVALTDGVRKHSQAVGSTYSAPGRAVYSVVALTDAAGKHN